VLLALEYSHWPKADRARRADEMLALVGLDGEKAQRRPARLSGGEQQRVAIARAFAAQPQLILADEPTGSLDKSTGQKIVQLLRSAASTQGATVLVVTHDEKVASQADRRLEIDDGVLAEIA
jgi:putative ABC transport system ATP-binding protein